MATRKTGGSAARGRKATPPRARKARPKAAAAPIEPIGQPAGIDAPAEGHGRSAPRATAKPAALGSMEPFAFPLPWLMGGGGESSASVNPLMPLSPQRVLVPGNPAPRLFDDRRPRSP